MKSLWNRQASQVNFDPCNQHKVENRLGNVTALPSQMQLKKWLRCKHFLVPKRYNAALLLNLRTLAAVCSFRDASAQLSEQ